MTELIVTTKNETLVVDSRLVAEHLGIEHLSFMKTIKRYEPKIETMFGVIRFEVHKPIEGGLGGRPEKFAWLTEDQSMFLMTLSRNTEQVVECKANLVTAFSQARLALENKVVEPVEVNRILPVHTAVEYAHAAIGVKELPDGILKQLVYDALVDELSLNQNLKYLPVAEKPKHYTIVKVRAKQLGYTDSQIKSGSQLGAFVKSQVPPSFQETIGRYPVYHYEINPDLDNAIHTFFSR